MILNKKCKSLIRQSMNCINASLNCNLKSIWYNDITWTLFMRISCGFFCKLLSNCIHFMKTSPCVAGIVHICAVICLIHHTLYPWEGTWLIFWFNFLLKCSFQAIFKIAYWLLEKIILLLILDMLWVLHLSSKNTAMLTKVIIILFQANIFRGFDLQLFLDTKFLPKCITRSFVSEWNIWPIIIM